MERQKKRFPIPGYLTSILAPSVIASIIGVSWPFFSESFVSPFLVAVVLCAWYGGLGPGFLSVVVSSFIADYFFMRPYFSFGPPEKADLTRLVIFIVIGFFISVLSESLHRARRLAEVNLDAIKEAEQVLREKERFVNQIAELSPVVINVFDLETLRNIYISPDVVNLLGFTSAEIAAMKDLFAEVWYPEDVTATMENLFQLKVAPDREIAEFEYRIRRHDGELRWLSSRAMPFDRNEQGEVRRIIAATIDITDRKQTAEALRASETRFRRLLDSSIVGVVFWTLQGDLSDANDLFLNMVGYSREDLRRGQLSWKAITPPEYTAVDNRAIAELLATGTCVPFEKEYIRKDGSRVSVLIGSALLEGQKEKGSSFVMDITVRKRDEEALRLSQERYRELFENARDTVYVHDLNGIYVSVNRAAEKLTGYSRDEIIGKHFSEFVEPKQVERVRNSLTKKLAARGGTSYEVDIVAKDGRLIAVEVSSNLIYENGGPVGVQGLVRDITERKQAEKALRGYSRQLLEAQEAERQSIARELHDQIGQVLCAVRINLQSIRNSSETSDSRLLIDEGLAMVDQALDQIRDLSFELRPSLLDDLGLAAALRWYADRHGQRSGVRVKTEIMLPEGRSRLSRELETACFRIVQEALTNVARHAQAQDVSITLRRLDQEILLSIRDDGIGFDQELLNRAPFPIRLGVRGMRDRALAVGGRVEIKSGPSQGTEICAYFPKKRKRPKHSERNPSLDC